MQLNVMFYDIFHLDCPNCPLELTGQDQNKTMGGKGGGGERVTHDRKLKKNK